MLYFYLDVFFRVTDLAEARAQAGGGRRRQRRSSGARCEMQLVAVTRYPLPYGGQRELVSRAPSC